MEFYFLIFSFLIIALVYSSVGFGGGSSYLALMALLSVSFEILRPTALLCNIVVVTGGSLIFIKEGLLDLKKAWPFFAASIPMAFLGGYFPVKQNVFFQVLAYSLLVAAILLWFQNTLHRDNNPVVKSNLAARIGLGSVIGFLSGMVSIGGGIFLSPTLHLLKWEDAKKISALASFFILVNSISGLAGQLSRNPHLDWKFIAPLLIAVLVGGQIGSRIGVKWFNAMYVKRITALLIFIAGLNILKDHW